MIEVNEYVRTKEGVIGKTIKVLSNRVFLDNLGYAVLINDILKHSKQLIDLIEVGDYVNGKYVAKIVQEKSGKYTIISLIAIVDNQDIKTILTKEQYMANCYKVGGE
jgi:hypothetical protein|nr:MAG TPA: hypothetical protein [Caudoviricetes sp.]